MIQHATQDNPSCMRISHLISPLIHQDAQVRCQVTPTPLDTSLPIASSMSGSRRLLAVEMILAQAVYHSRL